MPKRMITDRAELDEFLRRAPVGSLATLGTDGYPYIVPLNFVYLDGHIYFHCALHGRKLDDIIKNPRVCFNAWEMHRLVLGENAGDCSVRYTSVTCWGLAALVPDSEHKTRMLTALSAKYMDHNPAPPSKAYADKCMLVEIFVDEITGKQNVDK